MCKIVQVCFCWNMLFMGKTKLVSSSGKQISFSYAALVPNTITKHRLAPNSEPLPMSLYSFIISPYSFLLSQFLNHCNGRVFYRMHRNFQKTSGFLLSLFVSANLLEGDRFLEFFLAGLHQWTLGWPSLRWFLFNLWWNSVPGCPWSTQHGRNHSTLFLLPLPFFCTVSKWTCECIHSTGQFVHSRKENRAW